jgi:hypothetical protein
LNAVFESGSAKAFPVREQIDGFQEVCFSLSISAGKKIRSSRWKEFNFLDISILK